MLHKVLTTDTQLKLQNEGFGSIGFYLSTFANWDRVRPIPERPVKGAFAPYLADFIKDGFIAYAHEWGKLPIATVRDAHEDEYGLWVDADFHSTTEAQAVRTTIQERLNRGKTVKSSMGYDVAGDRIVPMDDPALQAQGIERGRELLKVPLYEGSIVNVPANMLADVTRVKALPDLAAVKSLYDTTTPLDWEAQEVLMCLLSYVREGRLLSEADPAALLLTASLLREALDTVGTLITDPVTQTAAKSTPPRRVPFTVEGDHVLRAASLFVQRAKSRATAYARKEGRSISTSNRAKLDELRTALLALPDQVRDLTDIIDELLAASAPPDKEKAGDLPTWAHEVLRFQAAQARASTLRLRS